MARVVIVGGGIAGLSAAYFLEQALRAGRWRGEIWLVERERRLGGKVVTEVEEGFLVEGGPDSFRALQPEGVALLRELGLEEEAVAPQERTVFVWRGGRLHPIPDALLRLEPRPAALWRIAALLGWRGWLRALLEPWIPPRRADGDEPLAAFLRRRFGRAFAEGIAEPLLAGIHAGDPWRLSLQALYPQFAELERRWGCLARGLRARPVPSSPGPAFLSLRSGMGALARRLAAALSQTHLLLGRSAVGLAAQRTDRRVRYRVALDDGASLEGEGVLLAVPAPAAAPWIAGLLPEAAALLRRIPFASVVVLSLAFRREQVGHPLRGSGFLVPRTEPFPLTACTWSSSKWPHRAPPGFVLLRAFMGSADRPPPLDVPDEALIAQTLQALRPVLRLQGDPIRGWVHRWPEGLPQYEVGHGERMAALARMLAIYPGLLLIGASYRGIGLPDLIRQAREAAQRLVALLQEDK